MDSTYLNPVYKHSCPDPFVLKYLDSYWCYATGIQPDGRCFKILQSPDLVHWLPVGSAMDPLPGDHTCYWAPEVVYRDGTFYLYYSVGDEEHMQMRVATAQQPGGPFLDSGHGLTSEKFAIDGHVFIDEDDRWYFFYAADFLEVDRVGTGTVVDEMLDPFHLAGKPRPVTRALYDWQIYDPERASKGGVRWHTLEGPFVLKHNGHYYQMFSGGNWQNTSYGVAYAITDRIDIIKEWQQLCDGENVFPVLRSQPEIGVIGPGHNSVVRGPDNRELFCIYHRWLKETEERVLAIDRLVWDGDRLVVLGPSTTPQPAPRQPKIAGFGPFQTSSGRLIDAGVEWRLEPNQSLAHIRLPLSAEDFVIELWLRFPEEAPSSRGSVVLTGESGEELRLTLMPGLNEVQFAAGERLEQTGLPAEFNPQAFHPLRVEREGSSTRISIDQTRLTWTVDGGMPPHEFHIIADEAAIALAGFALA